MVTQKQFAHELQMRAWMAGTVSMLVFLSVASWANAWTGPTQAAPGGNTPPPINTSATSQVKSGGFWAAAIGSDNGYCIGGSCITVWPASQWVTNGTSLYYTGGNVGIGTTAPIAPLAVSGSGNPLINIDASGGQDNSLWFTRSGVAKWYVYNDSPTNGFNIGNPSVNPALKISSSGNVGIGTNAPSAALTVEATTPYLVSTMQNHDPTGWSTINFIDAAGVTSGGVGHGNSANPSWPGLTYLSGALNSPVILATSNIERVRVTLAGNVGIGTTAPIAPLAVSGSGNPLINIDASGGQDNSLWFTRSGVAKWYVYNDSPTNGFNIGNPSVNPALKISSSGNVGIGTSNPVSMLHINSNATWPLAAVQNPSGWASLGMLGTSGKSLVIHYGGDSSNELRFGSYQTDMNTWIANVVRISMNAPDSSLVLDSSGNVIASAYLYSSDRRLKKDIQPLEGSLEKVAALRPVTYLWKDPQKSSDTQVGFIAQEVQQVMPEIVHIDPSTTFESVDYARLTPFLAGAINELHAKVESQQAQLMVQQQEIDALKAAIASLKK